MNPNNFSGKVHQNFPEDIKQYVRDKNVWCTVNEMMEDNAVNGKVQAVFEAYPAAFAGRFGIYRRVLGKTYSKMIEGYSYEEFLTELVHIAAMFLHERDEKNKPLGEMDLESVALATLTVKLEIMEKAVNVQLAMMARNLPAGSFLVLDEFWT